jgi:hypothetical protein
MNFSEFDNVIPIDSDTAARTEESRALIESQLAALNDRLRELPTDHNPVERARILLETARNLVLIGQGAEAVTPAREAFDIYLAAQDWEQMAEACNTLYQTDQSIALPALGQGIWLAVTYPVNPELTVALLEHVVDETPDDSDGAAIAATMAHFIAGLRAEDKQRDNLMFFTGQLLARVARRHSGVDTQEAFEAWYRKLELHDPALFLPRLRNVVDVLVQDDWWFDRDALSAQLPVN